jgi:hypothetical protein
MEIEKFKIWWDRDLDVCHIVLLGDQDEESAYRAVEKEQEMMDYAKENNIVDIGILYDIREAGKATTKAKQIFATYAKKLEKEFPGSRIAYVGGSKITILTSMFIHKIGGMRNAIKYFVDDVEALKWLNETRVTKR